MKKFYSLALSLFCFLNICFATYTSPGTNRSWTLADLVANSGGAVTLVGGEYFVNDIVIMSTTDTLSILTNTTVRFAASTYFSINGVIKIDPPAGVLFTAQNISSGFSGMILTFSSASVIRKLTFEYGNSLRVTDCGPLLDSCIFRYCSPLSTFGNAAISVTRANPVITNCQFLNNQRAAIQGGSNTNNAPKIMNCLFMGNNTQNNNVPQINLGSTNGTGADTVKIINNQILAASTNSGGIGFLPIGNVYALISGNTIRNNRYGLTFNGGSNINAMISYNIVENNNTQGDPNLGGSGISFVGGSATSHQNSTVTGNSFIGNLWGITIQNGSAPNLGNLTNTDTSDDGKNHFLNNTNATTPNIDLYNNSPYDIFAQGNYWSSSDPVVVESRIVHQPDIATLGVVNYSAFILPVQLSRFSLNNSSRNVVLNWETRSEFNTDRFEVERSIDGSRFSFIGAVVSRGNATSVTSYNFTDRSVQADFDRCFYKLKIIDKDGSISYSPVLSCRFDKAANHGVVNIFPNRFTGLTKLQVEYNAVATDKLTLNYYDASGKIISTESRQVQSGNNSFYIHPPAALRSGINYIQFSVNGDMQTIPVMKY